MAAKNLQEVIDASGNAVELLRNSQIGSYIYPVVPADFQNWIKEQKAWRDTAVLYDQSHHMDNLFMRGLRRDQADLRHGDQLDRGLPGRTRPSSTCPTTASGHVIGDGILFREAEDEYVYVGRAPAANWLMYPRRDRRLPNLDIISRPPLALAPVWPSRSPASYYRFQIQGPNAWHGHREAQRRAARAAEVLQHVDHEDRRHDGPHAPPRHGRRAGPRDLGPVRGPRPHPRRDRRGGRRVRPRSRSARAPTPRTPSSPAGSPPRCPAIYTGDELRRLPRVARRRQLRGDRHDRRLVRLRATSRTTT